MTAKLITVDENPVSDWTADYVPPLCTKTHVEPAPCDCGYVGQWEHRWWFEWYPTPGRKPTDRTVRQWIGDGLPARTDEGWWNRGGWDERCPGCGDIERFDWNAQEIDRFRVYGEVALFRRPV